MYFSLIVLVAETNKNIRQLFTIIINGYVSISSLPLFLGQLLSV